MMRGTALLLVLAAGAQCGRLWETTGEASFALAGLLLFTCGLFAGALSAASVLKVRKDG